MAWILYVRIRTDLDPEEMGRRLEARRPRFLEVPGLVQKVYARDPETGDVCGIYFFADRASLVAFRDSELAKTIPVAYEAVDVRREVYDAIDQVATGVWTVLIEGETGTGKELVARAIHRASSRRGSPRPSTCPRSVSVRARRATARSSCTTICWA